jgi:dipeptidyl-peptidase-4
VVEWSSLPQPFAERYLGDPVDAREVYAHHSLAEATAQSDHSRALLLVGATLPGVSSRASLDLDQELIFLRG